MAQASIASAQPPVFVADNNQVDLRSATVAKHTFEINIGVINDPDISIIEGRTGSASKIGTAMGGNVTVIRCTASNSHICNNWRKITYGSYSRWFKNSPQAFTIFTNDDGETFVVRAGPTFDLLHVNRLNARVLASPALVDGRWYFRTAGELLAIGR